MPLLSLEVWQGRERVFCLRNVWELGGISLKSNVTIKIFTTVLFGLKSVWWYVCGEEGEGSVGGKCER